MKQRVYVETSVVSYLTARQSSNLIVASHQLITRQWWESHRSAFELFISEAVMEEAAAGDPDAAERRIDSLAGIPLLEPSPATQEIAGRLVRDRIVPAHAVVDALHIGIAAAHGVDYLLTWNCKHIANASLRRRIAAVCRTIGAEMPVICTPEELLED